MDQAIREDTLILSGSEVRRLLDLPACIEAVAGAFRLHAEGRTLRPGVLGVPAPGGGFHVKAAGLTGERAWFAAKTNANFPDNRARFGLPTIQGTVVLCDARNGAPLAVMDSASVTALRTAAATAVAARALARAESRVVTLVGCGAQAEAQLEALACVLRLERVWLADAERARADALARRVSGRLGLRAEVADDLPAALRESDVCVTCTPARRFFVRAVDVRPGTFVAAVGADSEGKQELEPALVAASTLVVDSLEQCAQIGELQHALAAGLMSTAAVHAELAEVVAGRRPGRTRADEITVFDSTGVALQDVAAAAAVYEAARRAGVGTRVRFDG